MNKFCYIYDRNEHTLALAEAEACHFTNGTIVAHGVVECDQSVDWSSAGYLRGGGRLIASGSSLDELCGRLRELPFKTAGDYKIVPEPIPGERSGIHCAIVAVADSITGKVNLTNPQFIYLLVVSDEGCWFIENEPVKDRSWLDFKYKPCQFCNALPIRMGRAVLNLCAEKGDKVFDPCCGSGTIPLLASSMGMIALGGDISWPNFNIARKNISHFGYEAELKQEDATKATRQADCIVTNLPYGLYLPLSDEVLKAMLENFKRLSPKVVLITTMDITDRILASGYVIDKKITTKRIKLERNIYFLSH